MILVGFMTQSIIVDMLSNIFSFVLLNKTDNSFTLVNYLIDLFTLFLHLLVIIVLCLIIEVKLHFSQ
jgi:hypothetical protein